MGSDKRTDLAILKIEPGALKLPFLLFRDSDDLEVGDIVLAIGNPFGLGQTVTSGIISVIFGPRYMSMLYGFTFLSHQLGSFLGSWWGGKLYDYYGSYDIMWWICVLLGFVSAIMHLPIVEKPMVRKLA